MALKRTGQLSFGDALVSGAGAGVLDRIDGLVDWSLLAGVVSQVRAVDGGPGRPSWPGTLLLKALVLQSLYGLSDREAEAALADRLSFRRFCGLGLAEGVPDHAVLCRFRNALVAAGAVERLFAALDAQLMAAGVVVKCGTMLDATLLPTTAARPKDRPEKDQTSQDAPKDIKPARDPDAGFVRRQGKAGSVYGYKAHVGVDQGSGLVRSLRVTPANVNDTVEADALIRGDEASVWADAAYHTHDRAAALRARGVKPRLARRANKHHPLGRHARRLNRLIARRRAAVETTFATWKNRMGLTAIRYIGLVKARGQVTLTALAFNLRRWAALTA
jgi:IS5 family transposase